MKRLSVMYQGIRRASVLVAVGIVAALPLTLTAGAEAASSDRMAQFNAAAQEFDVPVSVLLALSYNESRWQAHQGVSADGGYGLMDLRTYTPTTVSGRD